MVRPPLKGGAAPGIKIFYPERRYIMKINKHYLDVKDSYLFAETGRKIAEYTPPIPRYFNCARRSSLRRLISPIVAISM